MKKIILGIVICLFAVPAFAAEQPTILLGLRWGDSEDVVHKRMQELNLELLRLTIFPDIVANSIKRKYYSGEVLGYKGRLHTGFSNGKLIRVSAFYGGYGEPVPEYFFYEIAEVLHEKYGTPKESDFNEDGLMDYHCWELTNINTFITLSVTDFEDCLIMLQYNDLEFLNEIDAKDKENARHKKQNLKNQL